MREHHLYALSIESAHSHQKRLAEAACDRMAAEATSVGPRRMTLRTRYVLASLAIFVAVQLSTLGARAGGFDGVYVNGARLSDDDVLTLVKLYGDPPPFGQYWYDPVSGLWGGWGQPPSTRIQEGLPFPGALSADASGGASGVFINGRQISDVELAFLTDSAGPLDAGSYTVGPQQAQAIYASILGLASPDSPPPPPTNPAPSAPITSPPPAPVSPPARPPVSSCVAQYGTGNRRFGPYATYNRGYQVASELQREGLTTGQVYHNGDGYYLNAWCA